MIGLKLVNGDLVFEGADLAMVEDGAELAQEARIALQTNNGEWFLNTGAGIDHRVILQKQPDQDAIRAQLIQGLRQTGRIQTVDELKIDFNRTARTLGVQFTATGADGEAVEQGVILGA